MQKRDGCGRHGLEALKEKIYGAFSSSVVSRLVIESSV